MDANIYYGDDQYQKMMLKAEDEKTSLTEEFDHKRSDNDGVLVSTNRLD